MSERYVLILAGTPQEGSRYAKRKGFRMGRSRVVASASSISNIQVADVHVLPSFHKRADSHAIMAKFRYSRSIEFFDVEMPELPVEDQGDGMGPQLDLMGLLDYDRDKAAEGIKAVIDVEQKLLDVAAEGKPGETTNRLVDAISDKIDHDAAALAAVEDLPEPTRKRRSRCKACGRMTLGADDPNHDPMVHSPAYQFDPAFDAPNKPRPSEFFS